MNIAITDIYGNAFSNDACFNLTACKIGENVLLPGIELKKELEKRGHEYHTIDMYDFDSIDVILFQDIPSSILTMQSWKDPLRYLKNRQWQKDILCQAVRYGNEKKRLLVMAEPCAVNPRSYNRRYHNYFDRIMTWDDDIVQSGNKYYKYYYPQPIPERSYYVPYSEKKEYTMICSNKSSNEQNELYSARKEEILYFENTEGVFDLYGFGWEKMGFRNYKGTTAAKLETLSRYKYCICYENNCKVKGYITEKIFDCFFSGTVPIYWGAENISEYIPEDCYIDRRKFSSMKEVCRWISHISEAEYANYIDAIHRYLSSDLFREYFSVSAFVKRMASFIIRSD